MTDACDECGFDGRGLTMTELASLIRRSGSEYPAALDIAQGDRTRLGRRLDAQTWSALEYTLHARDAVRYNGWLIKRALTEEDAAVERPDPNAVVASGRYNETDPQDALTDLAAQTERFAATISALNPAVLTRSIRRGDELRTVESLARSAAHEVHHHLLDVRRVLEV